MSLLPSPLWTTFPLLSLLLLFSNSEGVAREGSGAFSHLNMGDKLVEVNVFVRIVENTVCHYPEPEEEGIKH